MMNRLRQCIFWIVLLVQPLLFSSHVLAAIEWTTPVSFCYSSGQDISCRSTVQAAGDSACATVSGVSAINIVKSSPSTWLVNCSYDPGRTFAIIQAGNCPIPASPPSYLYNSTTELCERQVLQCTAPTALDPATNRCEPPKCVAPETLNPVTNICEPPITCPVDALTNPPFADECSTSLEKGGGVDVNQKCGTLREPDMVAAANCIADKIKALSTPRINYSGPSATIRTAEYQNHLREIWDKSVSLDTIMNSVVYTPEIKQACIQRKADVDSEKSRHGLDSQPSSSESKAPHVEHRAIDIPRSVSKELIKQVSIYTFTIIKVNGKNILKKTLTSDVEDYIHSATVNPPACDSRISWGGRFNPVDRVHFQLPALPK